MTKLELAKAFVAQIKEPEKVTNEYTYPNGNTYRFEEYANGSPSKERYIRQLVEARALLMDALKEVTNG